VEEVHGAALVALQLGDERNLALQELFLGLVLLALLDDRLQPFLFRLGLGDLGAEHAALAFQAVPAPADEQQSQDHHARHQDVLAERPDALEPRGLGGARLDLLRPREEVDLDHRLSPARLAARPTAIDTLEPISSTISEEIPLPTCTRLNGF